MTSCIKRILDVKAIIDVCVQKRHYSNPTPKFQVSSLFLDNLHMTIKQTHPQAAKLIEADLCLSKLKDLEECNVKTES